MSTCDGEGSAEGSCVVALLVRGACATLGWSAVSATTALAGDGGDTSEVIAPRIGPLEAVPCPLCDASDSSPWGSENGFDAVRCASCGLVYVTPRPPLADIGDAARTGQHSTDDGELVVTGHFRRVRVLARRRFLRATCGDLLRDRPLRWLDVGAGHGELLLALRAELPPGSSLRGVEPNEAKAAPLRLRGFEVDRSVDDVDDVFDVVSLINVYSHLPRPVEHLRSLHRVLREGGELVLETGNGAELERREDYPDALDLPDHLSFAGESQLRLLLDRAGFDGVAVHRRRIDGIGAFADRLVRRTLDRGRGPRLWLPYRSPFRSLVVRGRRRS